MCAGFLFTLALCALSGDKFLPFLTVIDLGTFVRRLRALVFFLFFVTEKKTEETSAEQKKKKGMDIFADDDDMFSENYSHVSMMI